MAMDNPMNRNKLTPAIVMAVFVFFYKFGRELTFIGVLIVSLFLV